MIYAENILICITVPLIMSLMFIRGSARRFVISFVAGMSVSLISAYIGGFFKMTSGMSAEDTSIFLSPIIEEIMKFFPVLFYLLMFEPKEDELLLSAIGIGSGFATFENCCYILSSGADSLSYISIRGFAVGVMHLVTMITLALGFNLLKKYRVFTFSGILGALSLAMTFHSLYNLLVSKPGPSSYVGYAMPVIFAELLYFFRGKYKEKNA